MNRQPRFRRVAPGSCIHCRSPLVQPVDARACEPQRVALTLRCPECETVFVQDCDWETARSFGRNFAAGRARLRLAYEEVAGENLREELERFVTALDGDLIGPDDFVARRQPPERSGDTD